MELDNNFWEYEEFDVVQVNYDGPFLNKKPIDIFNGKEQATHLVKRKRVKKKKLSIKRFSKSKNVDKDSVQVNYDGPFLNKKPIDIFNGKEQATHLVKCKRVKKKKLSIKRFSKSKNVDMDSVQEKKLWNTINKLEKTTKYRLADIREAIRKRNLKKRSVKRKYHITYYNSSTKHLKGYSSELWQFQGLGNSLNTEASPNRIRDVFSFLRNIHCAFLPSLPAEDAELPKYSEKDLQYLMRLQIKDESLLCFDFCNKNDYFEAIEYSLDRIERNPYLILQYQLDARNTPEYKIKTFPYSDGNLILDHFINRLIALNKEFHRNYPELCAPINPLNNFLKQPTSSVSTDSPQNMVVESNSKTSCENNKSPRVSNPSILKAKSKLFYKKKILPIKIIKRTAQNGLVSWNLKKKEMK